MFAGLGVVLHDATQQYYSLLGMASLLLHDGGSSPEFGLFAIAATWNASSGEDAVERFEGGPERVREEVVGFVPFWIKLNSECAEELPELDGPQMASWSVFESAKKTVPKSRVSHDEGSETMFDAIGGEAVDVFSDDGCA